MDELVFTAKELMVASAKLGAVRFFGLPDPFYGMEPEEIQGAVSGIQLALEKKGYAQMGFDDSFTLKSDVKNLLETAALCERYVMLRSEKADGGLSVAIRYERQGKAVLLRETGKALTLTRTEDGAAAAFVTRELGGVDAVDPTAGEVLLSEETLTAARLAAAEDKAKAAALLTEQGCSGQTAAGLVQGLRREADLFVICIGDLQQRTLRHLIVFAGKEGWVSLIPTDVDERTWTVKPGVTDQTIARLFEREEDAV